MTYYRQVGDIPPTRHTQFRGPTGTLYREELMGEEGFVGDSSLLYHVGAPSAIVDATTWELPDQHVTANHPLKPRHLRLPALFADVDTSTVDAVTGRRLLLANADVRISYVVAGAASPLYRDAVGDECVYVEAGQARVETVFGVVDAREGDYVVLPQSTTHRIVPTGDRPLAAYCIEGSGHLRPPARYLSRFGQLLESAPYCERDLHGPSQPLVDEGGDVAVLVKHRGDGPTGVVGTRYVYATHPFDVVGWDGCLYPFTFNVADFQPITGRVHQPPPVHQVFQGDNFVVCNFCPRKVDYHPLAIPIPYFHSNVDSDEIMFYCGGSYEARAGSGIALGSISLHPGGFAHGPQPGAVEAALGVELVDELAVMIDTFRPVALGAAALACEDPGYAWTWARRGPPVAGPAAPREAGEPDGPPSPA